MQLKGLIVDDEAQARAALRQELEFHCGEIEIVAEAATVKEAVDVIDSVQPNIVFLDIQLTDGLGFDVLEQLNQHTFHVIFTTAYSEYALKAIKFSALDYLLKPIDGKELRAAVDKAIATDQSVSRRSLENYIRNQTLQGGRKRIALHTSEGIRLVELQSIIRCQSDGNYTAIHFTDSKRILIAKTLKEFEELLTPFGFERVHISHLVNLEHLRNYSNKEGGHLEMSDNTVVPVAQRKKSRLLELLGSWNSSS